MPKEISDNPGQENNTSTPTDESQSRQIGDMLMDGPSQPEVEDLTQEPEARNESVEVPEREEDVDRFGYIPGERERRKKLAEEEREEETEPVLETEEEDEIVPEPADSDLKKEVNSLREMIQGLQTQLQQSQQQEEPEPELPKIEVNPDDFLTEDELDEFSVDPGAVLKKALARVYQKAREDTLRDMPDVVGKATQRSVAVQEARNQFWSENPDIYERVQGNQDFARFVRGTVNKVQAENPAWTVPQILDESGKRVRKAVDLTKQAQKVEKDVTSGKNKQHGKPRSKRRGGQPADNRTDMQKQLDKMAATARR